MPLINASHVLDIYLIVTPATIVAIPVLHDVHLYVPENRFLWSNMVLWSEMCFKSLNFIYFKYCFRKSLIFVCNSEYYGHLKCKVKKTSYNCHFIDADRDRTHYIQQILLIIRHYHVWLTYTLYLLLFVIVPCAYTLRHSYCQGLDGNRQAITPD